LKHRILGSGVKASGDLVNNTTEIVKLLKEYYRLSKFLSRESPDQDPTRLVVESLAFFGCSRHESQQSPHEPIRLLQEGIRIMLSQLGSSDLRDHARDLKETVIRTRRWLRSRENPGVDSSDILAVAEAESLLLMVKERLSMDPCMLTEERTLDYV
jgi:hypothetical protein